MKSLNLPAFNVKLRRVGEQSQIFDEVRRKWLALTPEEWVRQHFIHYLNTYKNYPLSLMAVEKGLEVYGLKKRYDLVCYDAGMRAVMLVECKAPEVPMDQKVLEQAAIYNWKLKVPYLVVTNGIEHYCAEIDTLSGSWRFLNEIPAMPV